MNLGTVAYFSFLAESTGGFIHFLITHFLAESTLWFTMATAHPFHLVDGSPWPILTALALSAGALLQMPDYFYVLILLFWWRDVIRESTGGFHTTAVQRGLLLGFILFLLSEIMLFVSFFWAFFHSSLSPAIELANVWPPLGLNAVNPWAIPFLGSGVLLASGFLLTLSHLSYAFGKDYTIITLLITTLLGVLFLILQFNEYRWGEFTIADSVFGSLFYMTTGLHAIHVIVGVIFLAVALVRISRDSFTADHHLGLEFAIFYWHLVDAVWLVVFLLFYWWCSS